MARWLVAAAVGGVLLAGCAEGGNVVSDVASEAEQKVELARYCVAALDLVQAIDERDADAAVDAGESLVEHAPDEIRPEAETLLAAAEEARSGDAEALQGEDVRQAAKDLQAFTTESCDPKGG